MAASSYRAWCASNVFRCHIPRYEAIIARYLDMEPAQIWPSRYMEKTSC
ncbi:hypothetical protein BHP27_11830 [Shigella flexneri]|nr:hypothetical protein [Shigella flexneri]EFZ5852398.1 hypothetical protein [Shigella flexneri]